MVGPWGQIVLAKWQRLPDEVRGSSGLCFNDAGGYGPVRHEGGFAETAARLGVNFNLADEVVQALIATQMQNLEEFRFYFEDISKIEPWLTRIQLGGIAGGARACAGPGPQ